MRWGVLRTTRGGKVKNEGLGESHTWDCVLRASVLFGSETRHLYKGRLD